MPTSKSEAVRAEYATPDSLRVRLETHRLYSEKPDDLHGKCRELLRLSGDERILDVGSGPGEFQADLAAAGHRGMLVGLDMSFGMATEGAGRAGIARWAVGDAQTLPIRQASVDRAVARHMLYHVPDIPAALLELKRVLRPRGVALFTTNGEGSLPALRALRARVADAFDLPRPPGSATRSFSSRNAAALLGAAFSNLRFAMSENALLFSDALPAARYIESTFTLDGVAADVPLREEMRAWLVDAVEAEIQARGGALRDPKYVLFYVAETR